MSFLCIVCADSSLGKVDKSTLSQQTLMELFIDKISNKEKICGSAANPKDLCEWKNVIFRDTHLIRIRWESMSLNGSIALQWLPPTVENVIIENRGYSTYQLAGTIDLTHLPNSVECLRLSSNRFCGEISLTSLPRGIKMLDVANNRLSGPLDLTRLPQGMKLLWLFQNNFSGETDFSQLPESPEQLNFTYNRNLKGIYCLQKPDVSVMGTQVEFL